MTYNISITRIFSLFLFAAASLNAMQSESIKANLTLSGTSAQYMQEIREFRATHPDHQPVKVSPPLFDQMSPEMKKVLSDIAEQPAEPCTVKPRFSYDQKEIKKSTKKSLNKFKTLTQAQILIAQKKAQTLQALDEERKDKAKRTSQAIAEGFKLRMAQFKISKNRTLSKNIIYGETKLIFEKTKKEHTGKSTVKSSDLEKNNIHIADDCIVIADNGTCNLIPQIAMSTQLPIIISDED